MKMYRHGDVLLIKVDKLPENIKFVEKTNNVILEGEVTGHAHKLEGNAKILEIAQEIANKANIRWAINGEDVEEKGIIGYAVVDGKTDLVHEEHNTITLPTGIYQIRRQREYDEKAIRFVQD